MVTLSEKLDQQTSAFIHEGLSVSTPEEEGSSHIRWRDKIKNVVRSFKERLISATGKITSYQEQKAMRALEKHGSTYLEYQRSALRFHDGLQGIVKNDQLTIVGADRVLTFDLEADGGISDATVQQARREGITLLVQKHGKDFPKSHVTIRERKISGTRGTLSHTEEREGVRIQYRHVSNGLETIQPDTLLFTLNDEPTSPVLRLPLQADGSVLLRYDADPTSLQGFLLQRCFLQKNGRYLLSAHRLEAASLARLASGTEVRSLASKSSFRYRSPYRETVPYPTLPADATYAIDIRKKAAHVSQVKIARPVVSTEIATGHLAPKKKQTIIEEWFQKHQHLWDKQHFADLQVDQAVDLTEISPLTVLVEDLRRNAYNISPSIQARALEYVRHAASRAELEAIIELDVALRVATNKLPWKIRLLPAMTTNSLSFVQTMQLDLVKKQALYLAPFDKPGREEAHVLLGGIHQLIRQYELNQMEQKSVVSDYFVDQKPQVTRERWAYLQNEADLLLQTSQSLEHLYDHRDLLSTISKSFDELSFSRQKLSVLLRQYGGSLNAQYWGYVLSAFTNVREHPASENDLTEVDLSHFRDQPLVQSIIALAQACHSYVQHMHMSLDALQVQLEASRSAYIASPLEGVYLRKNFMELNTQAGVLLPQDLQKDLRDWISKVDHVDHITKKSTRKEIQQIRQEDFQHLLRYGESFLYTCYSRKLTSKEVKPLLGEIYGNFLTLRKNPLVLSMMLEMYLALASIEKPATTFAVTQSVIRRQIGFLPDSWPKKKSLLHAYETLRTRR